ncbi:MAG: energy transducer TonB [Thermodesulfobacteriota bacterium]
MAAYGPDAVDERPSVLRRVEPRYPEQARRRREEGKVLVRLVVDAQGRPTDCAVLASEPAGTFDAAALEAVRRFRFRPGKLAGRAVATVVHIPFAFSLH